MANYLRQQQGKRVRALKDAGADADAQRFRELLVLFRKYGERYGFDPLMLAAQGYQESQLNQQAKSHVGAIGVMQIMPATGAELKVGDIRVTEANIHGGAKYMDQLMTRYFKDVDFSPANRALFAFASYNAGPGNIAKMRKEAEKRGLDPDKWFNNVELVTAEKIGIETTTYVRNIFKYYTSYKLTLESRAGARQGARAGDQEVGWADRAADHAVGAQRGDGRVVVAQLAQQLQAVFAQRRRRAAQRQPLAGQRQRQQRRMRCGSSRPAALASAGSVTGARPPVARRCGSSNSVLAAA